MYIPVHHCEAGQMTQMIKEKALAWLRITKEIQHCEGFPYISYGEAFNMKPF